MSKGQNAVILSPARANDSDITLITAVNQDDSRNWAHSVAPTSIARRVINDDRSKPMINASTSNVTSMFPVSIRFDRQFSLQLDQ